MNARVAFRLAHGWSQREAADEWTKRWPADPKTFKNLSYWELWPSSSGYAPSLDVLDKLAQLYECRLADLLVDCADHRHLDQAQRTNEQLQTLPELVRSPAAEVANDGVPTRDGDPSGLPSGLPALVDRLEELDVHDIARVAATLAQRLDPNVGRRLLLKVSRPRPRSRRPGNCTSQHRRSSGRCGVQLAAEPVGHLAQPVRLLQQRTGAGV